MIPFSKRAIAINVGAGLTIIAAAASFVHTSLARPSFEVCTSRYNRQLSMPLERDGAVLTASDLQALANGQDEGLTDNLTIAHFRQGPAPLAMGVRLAGGTTAQRATGVGLPGGISMPWTPSLMEQPQAACLSYDVFLPADFDFGNGGTLPGLFATTINRQYVGAPHVAANLSWQSGGAPALFIESRAADGANAQVFGTHEKQLPRGRWLRVDQEVILNTPGKADGAVRLWFDGQLETEVKAADLRPSAEVTLAGVAGDVFFGGSGTQGIAKSDATVWVSAFELRWN